MMLVSSRWSPLAWKCKEFVNQSCTRCFRREFSFHDLGINVKLTRLLRSKGIRQPTDIQEKAILSLLAGDSAVINSETGSGKTLAYALPIVNVVQELRRKGLTIPCPYGLIVVPNTELQYQVSNVFRELLGANVCPANEDTPLRLLNTEVVVSTAPFLMTYQLDVFRQVQTIVFDEADIMIARKVGKHGRKDPLFNLINKFLETSHFQCFVDGDNMPNTHGHDINDTFNVGNHTLHVDNLNSVDVLNIKDDVLDEGDNSIFRNNRQFVFVGATMPTSERLKSKVAMRYIQHWVPDINVIQTENVHKILSNVEMTYLSILEGNKLKLLVETLKDFSTSQKLRVLVFVNTLDCATSLYSKLTPNSNSSHFYDNLNDSANFLDDLKIFHLNWGGKIHLLHRDVPVNDRMEIFDEFSVSPQSLMITTDVASRGLDFPDIDVVVQYDFATNVIDILHRSGRTGRMGKQGKVVNFITEKDETLSNAVQEVTSNKGSLESLFSRRRGLQRKIKRQAKRAEDDSLEDSAPV